MKVLVTGGAGFIGSMLCRRLVERGDGVVVIDNLSNGRRELVEALGEHASLKIADVRDAQAVRQIVADTRPDAVCHLAAIHFIPYCNEHPAEALEINVVGTLNVLEACRVFSPRMVVVASSAAVYPPRDGLNRETDSVEPMDIYGMSKEATEQLARLYASQTGAACIAARIFNAVGPNETNPHLVPHLVEQLRRGQISVELGNLEPYRDYIDTTDLSDALICLLDLRRSEYDVFNIGTGKEYSVRQVVEMCGTILGRPVEVRQKPTLVRKVERMHLCASVAKIQAVTEWRPRFELAATLQSLLTANGASENIHV